MSDMTLESIMNSWWEYQKRNMFTAIPARVVQVRDMGECRVDVQPLTNTVFPDYTDDLEFPDILHVPVMFPSSSSSAVTFPIHVGDTVLLVFSQKSMDVFKSGDGTPHSPNDFRQFDKRDACAIPGLWPFGMSKNSSLGRTLTHNTSDTVISHNIGTDNECEVRLKESGEVQITSPLKVTVTAPVCNVSATTSAAITAPSISATATTSATITSPISSLVSSTSVTITSPITAVVGASFTWNGRTVATA